MKARMIAAAALAAVLGLAAATGLAKAAGPFAPSGAAAAQGTVAFTDPVGDAPGAPDISAVTLSDVAATGMINVAVTVGGMTAQPASAFVVYLDMDKNAATGSSSGAEYALSAGYAEGEWAWFFERWADNDWQDVQLSQTMSYSRSGDVFTFTLNKSDLGGTTGFGFYVGAFALDANANIVGRDYAPDDGLWTDDLSAPLPVPAVVKPLIGAPQAAPATARAGKPMTVRFIVTRSSDGRPLTGGTMICDPSVGGKVLAHAEQFAGGVAQLTFTIPKNATGKLLTVKVTVKVGGQTATKIATFRVH